MTRILPVCAVICFFALPKLVAETKPTITANLSDGSYIVSGKAQARDGTSYSAVSIWVCNGAAPAAGTPPQALADCGGSKLALTNGNSDTVSSDANGNYSAILKTKLTAGTQIWVMQSSTPIGGGAAGVPVPSDGALVGAAASKITIRTPVKDGQNPIVGSAPASASGSPVQVQLWVAPAVGQPTSPQGDAELVGQDGIYTLHETVYVGQQIEVKQLGTGAQTSDLVTVQPTDNPREHVDFVAGTVVSQGESNFAQADTFLALNYDRALLLPGWYLDKKEKQVGKKKIVAESRRIGLNTFFQARLTTIPVNSTTTTSTTTTPASGTGTTATATPSFSSVLSSQKTGHFEIGVYAPYVFAQTPKQDPKTQTFYGAPLARFGFNTLAGNPQSTTTTPSCSNSSGQTTGSTCPSGSGTTTTTTTPGALGTGAALPSSFNFFVLGARIGTAKLEPGSLHNVHYLDMAIGKFSNLENLACLKGPQMCVISAESRYRPWRLSFEGYYEMPGTGFIVGMSANVGAGVLDGHRNTDINNRAASDLRFLFGYKFDAVKLFKAIPMLQ